MSGDGRSSSKQSRESGKSPRKRLLIVMAMPDARKSRRDRTTGWQFGIAGGFFCNPVVQTSPQRRQIALPAIPAGLSFTIFIFLDTTPRGMKVHGSRFAECRPRYARCAGYGGAHTKRKFKYRKEQLSSSGLESECIQEERSTSITKQLVSSTRFAVKRAVIEFWSVFSDKCLLEDLSV